MIFFWKSDGFRKVKSDHVMNADWWEFRHPLFRRDEPEKIAEIKRSVHFGKILFNDDFIIITFCLV